MYIFDAHQDIADALLFSSHGDFWRKNDLQEGWNRLGLPVNNQVDFPRLKEAAVKALFGASCAFSVGEKGEIAPSKNHFLETLCQLNLYHRLQREREGQIQIIKTRADLKKITDFNLSFLLSVEGADSIEKDSVALETFFNLGVRSIGLTWNYRNGLAGGCAQEGGLTELGKRVIKKMENLGIALDLAHLNEESFFQALEVSEKPVFVSHTACRSVHEHMRNITDEQIKAVAKGGGVVGICGVPKFVGELNIKKVVDHFMHAIKVAGIEHVVIGTDFGAMTDEKLISGFQEVNNLPKLIETLRKGGLSNEDIEKICHGNLERFLAETLP